MEFAVVRLLAGAGMLVALVLALARQRSGRGGTGRCRGWRGCWSICSAFRWPIVGLTAGTGALILFGVVQITMFARRGAGAARCVPPRRWAGAALALAGLVVLLAPAGGALAPHARLMAAAGVGWGVYSLAGRGQRRCAGGDGVRISCWRCRLGLASGLLPGVAGEQPQGMALAVLSGAVTSGLGYALWYPVVPQLGAARAAVAQLTVPMLAAAGGAALIGEAPAGDVAGVACGLVLGGWRWRA